VAESWPGPPSFSGALDTCRDQRATISKPV
jgi:hypothetical protein